MTYNENQKIAEIVADNYNQIVLLEHFGIPLVVQEQTVKDICKKYKLSTELFLTFVRLFNNERITHSTHFDEKDIHCIILYLTNCHQYYLQEKAPKIVDAVNLIVKNNQNAGTTLLSKFVDEYIEEITEHFAYENDIVFPYITALAKGEKTGSTYSVIEYKHHHSNIDDKLVDIKNLLIKYLPFEDKDHLRRNLLASLFELEYDLKIHSHIEDVILIPLVENYEQKQIRSKL